MSAPQRIESQLVIYPLPIDVTPCPECYGLIWSDAPCEQCDDVGSIDCIAEDGGCCCVRCKREEASMRAEYEHERSLYPQRDFYDEPVGCRDCGGTEFGCVRCRPERFL